jgi:hypothetical protein
MVVAEKPTATIAEWQRLGIGAEINRAFVTFRLTASRRRLLAIR